MISCFYIEFMMSITFPTEYVILDLSEIFGDGSGGGIIKYSVGVCSWWINIIPSGEIRTLPRGCTSLLTDLSNSRCFEMLILCTNLLSRLCELTRNNCCWGWNICTIMELCTGTLRCFSYLLEKCLWFLTCLLLIN